MRSRSLLILLRQCNKFSCAVNTVRLKPLPAKLSQITTRPTANVQNTTAWCKSTVEPSSQ